MTSQEPGVGEASDADVNKAPPYAQDGGAEESVLPLPPGVMMKAAIPVAPELPLPMSSQEPEGGKESDADVNKAPSYAQDGRAENLVLPPPGVMMKDSGGSDSGRPHPSTLPPMYMDRREVLPPTVQVHSHCRSY